MALHSLFPGLLGWWRSPEVSCRRPAGRPAEAGPRPLLRATQAAAAQPLLFSLSQAAPAEGPCRHGRSSRVAATAGGGPQQGEALPALRLQEGRPRRPPETPHSFPWLPGLWGCLCTRVSHRGAPPRGQRYQTPSALRSVFPKGWPGRSLQTPGGENQRLETVPVSVRPGVPCRAGPWRVSGDPGMCSYVGSF